MGPIGYSNLTESAAVKAGPGILFGAVLTAGNDTATLILYDNTAGSGTIIVKLSAAANTSAAFSVPSGVRFSNLYAALTGTGPSVSVFW